MSHHKLRLCTMTIKEEANRLWARIASLEDGEAQAKLVHFSVITLFFSIKLKIIDNHRLNENHS